LLIPGFNVAELDSIVLSTFTIQIYLPTFWLKSSGRKWSIQSKCQQGFPISKLVSEKHSVKTSARFSDLKVGIRELSLFVYAGANW